MNAPKTHEELAKRLQDSAHVTHADCLEAAERLLRAKEDVLAVHERELLYRRSAVEAEREACAKIAELLPHAVNNSRDAKWHGEDIAAAIRARGKEEG